MSAAAETASMVQAACFACLRELDTKTLELIAEMVIAVLDERAGDCDSEDDDPAELDDPPEANLPKEWAGADNVGVTPLFRRTRQ